MASDYISRHRPQGENFVVIFDLAKLMANDEHAGRARLAPA